MTIRDAITSSSQPTQGDPNISWPIERLSNPSDEWHPLYPSGSADHDSNPSSESSDESSVDSSIYPDGTKSLSGISLRAFLLGITLSLATSLTILLMTIFPTPFWRVPSFIATLSLFHFLEFFVTARYNTHAATVSAFLLSSNGWAYNVAHGSAIVECIVTNWLWPDWSNQTTLGKLLTVKEPLFGSSISLPLVVGLLITAVGQVVRTIAMAQAGSNFNHHVQSEHRAGHVLVTKGLYHILRHPSYFGFFWWGIGTQLVLGNVVCLVAYAAVLWRFFSTRIKREEAFLIRFFGAEYVQYRQATPVGIPGIH
ncbi:Isoprenylcysteine carboxyl methyltransferase [Penicillium taxi]|uniref:Isoprenylcysteine carboxyl methyltransferase n=1 Tax=Penicillium taxi TaxID=168475 RepID=UPI0025452FAF|nr:Isoprenylcysteine carboxyl methyltransferase [Penicillium taxi]KAJ5894980.1 Isoprenylcysteine carboxyl methyltransferase [Penicillium taxi]